MNCQIISRFCGYLGAATVAVAALGYTGAAQAGSDWPTGPVTIIPHSKPGGSPDVFARTLAQSLKDVIGQSIVIINAPGGGGAMQMAKVRAAKPDGLTFGVSTLTHLSAMQGTLKETFAPDDFSWIVAARKKRCCCSPGPTPTSKISTISRRVRGRAKSHSAWAATGRWAPCRVSAFRCSKMQRR